MKEKGFGKYYGITFLIGLGFFTMGLMDPLYDTYVPIFLEKYVALKSIIGAIMTLDNIFALALIPVVSALSDRTRTPLGRRMPYILITLPLTALFFGAIPYAAAKSLFILIAVVFFLNIFKQAARGPVVALMPDIIPGEYRSEANGVINTMGGIAAIVGTVGLARLMDLDMVLPLIGRTKDILPFPIAGVLVGLATLLLFLFVKEKEAAAPKDQEEKIPPLRESLGAIIREKDKSVLLILVALFLWFLGYQGVLPFIGLYSEQFIGVSRGTAALAAGMVGIAYAIFAIPSGIVAHRLGRRHTIRVSLVALVVIAVLLYLHHWVVAALSLPRGLSIGLFWALMFLFGIFWVAVITNSFPMLWQMASYGTMGIYTGLYYTFSQAAAILAPPLTGGVIDLLGFRMIFIFAALCMAAAFVVMGYVRQGEAGGSSG